MLKVAAVFSDKMVLQRGKRIAVFGEGDYGKTITALIYKQDDMQNCDITDVNEEDAEACIGCPSCHKMDADCELNNGCEQVKRDELCEQQAGCGKCCGGACAVGSDSTEVDFFGDSGDGQGYAADMELVSELIVDSAEAVVDKNGKWILYLPEQQAGTGYVVEVYCGDESKCFYDVAVGEVFLAGGQSNMELELQNCVEWTEVQKLMGAEDKPNDIRFYYTQKRSYFDEKFFEDETNTGWAKFGEEWTKAWSAVGYFFAERLSKSIDCPIGIIGCNWGGTSASCWMSRETLVENIKTKSYVDEYNASPYVLETPEEQIRDYEEYLEKQAEWDRKCAEVYKENPNIPFSEVEEKIGKNLYPGPMNGASFLRPAGLYETMLMRVCPYSLKGFIYYQGETDDCKADSYYVLMSNLIRQWRNDWGDDTLPFILTQLPMHRYFADPDYKHWCIIREAQMKVYNTVKNTGMAVIIDQGEFSEIHPKRKRVVGERLALQALAEVYGLIEKKDANGPMYDSHLYRDNGIEIHFKYVNNGLAVHNRRYGNEPWKREDELTSASTGPKTLKLTEKGKPVGFEIAGADGVYVEAEAELCANNTCIFVHAEQVENPVSVRYLWTNYSEVNLYSGSENDIPVAPFRTSQALR